jgi:hypothetical protein
MKSQEATISMIATTLSVMPKQLLAVEALARDAARHSHLSLGQSKANAERLTTIVQTATDTLNYVRYTHERVGSLERRAEVTGRVGGQDPVRLTLSTPSENPRPPFQNQSNRRSVARSTGDQGNGALDQQSHCSRSGGSGRGAL